MPSSARVEHSTHNPKTEGSYPATSAGVEKIIYVTGNVIIKLLITVINCAICEYGVFVTVCHFYLSLTFKGVYDSTRRLVCKY